MSEGLRQEIQSDYGQALSNVPAVGRVPLMSPSSVPAGAAATVWGENGQDNNIKNGFKETWRVLQRNLLRCHPLIHRPAVHLRSKLLTSTNVINSTLSSR